MEISVGQKIDMLQQETTESARNFSNAISLLRTIGNAADKQSTALRKDLAGVTKRQDALEQENREMRKQIEDILQTIDVVGPWWQVASFLAKCTIVLPRFDAWFVALIAVLYLIEAHSCSTRRYLANALSGPAAVEDYIEGLRQAPPVARWTVRCFHYEQRKSLAWLSFLLRMLLGTDTSNFVSDAADGMEDSRPTSCANHIARAGLSRPTSQGPSFLTKKVVTHQATKTYQCVSWKDETTVGLWKRAWSPELTAPFTKLSLCKVLLLSNGKARSDYFTQQTDFVMREGSKDQYAEFSTNIDVEGFKSRVLAVRTTRRGPLSSRFFRLHLFWIFTCLGLTVPYRIWFARHCDELRVAVIKETFATGKKPKPQSSSSWTKWFVRSKESDQAAFDPNVASLRSDFRKRMEELAIYQADEAEETRETAALLQQQELEKELEGTVAPADKEENKEEESTSLAMVSEEVLSSPQDHVSQPAQLPVVDVSPEENTAAATTQQDDDENNGERATDDIEVPVDANRNEGEEVHGDQ